MSEYSKRADLLSRKLKNIQELSRKNGRYHTSPKIVWSLENFDAGRINRGRFLVYLPNHPRAHKKKVEVLRSIVAYETYHNTTVPENMHIHHKDGNKLNDSKENLKMLTPKQHKRTHLGIDINIAKTKTDIETTLKVPIKASKGCHPLLGNKTFCGAVFFCKDKWLKRIQQRRGGVARNYQICKFLGRCNQQCDMPVYWEV